MSDELRDRIARYRAPDGLPAFAAACLKVRAKDGDFVPLVLNPAQQYVNARLDQQLDQKGYVRAFILKGRQAGISTFIAARYYRRASLWRGVNTYILTHEQSASDTLFGMVDRFQHNNPIAPHVGTANAKELEFDRLDSSYVVATAGSKAGGRSKAISLFHGSEVAFWPNAAEHFSASVQGVPLMPGTEIILESTSAGAGGEFYERCQDALAERGEYQLIFLPWWMTPEYAAPVPEGFELSTEEADGEMSEDEYARTYGLTLAQMAWRRAKLFELRDPLLFRREYPATVQEAWTAPPGHEPYISALQVIRARKRPKEDVDAPLIIGIDPASGGGDRFAAAARRGRRVEWVRYRNKLNHEEAVAWIRSLIDEHNPVRVNIDAGNIGANIVTSLRNAGQKYALVIRGVNFGGTSQWKLAKPKVPGPFNRRAEMYQRLAEWLELPEGAVLPDDENIQADIVGPQQKPRLDGSFQLESKVDMRKRGVRSPDLADAIALTFAFVEFFTDYAGPKVTPKFGNVDKDPGVALPIARNRLAGTPNGWMGVLAFWLCGAALAATLHFSGLLLV